MTEVDISAEASNDNVSKFLKQCDINDEYVKQGNQDVLLHQIMQGHLKDLHRELAAERDALKAQSEAAKRSANKWMDRGLELASQNEALEAENERLLGELDALQDEYNDHQEKVSSEFEGDCWVALRNLLNLAGFGDWSEPDGVNAEMAYEYLKESWDAGTAQAAEIERRTSAHLKELSGAMAEIERLNGDVASVTNDRQYIIGFNHGFEEAEKQNNKGGDA